jgi:hypothetical protein
MKKTTKTKTPIRPKAQMRDQIADLYRRMANTEEQLRKVTNLIELEKQARWWLRRFAPSQQSCAKDLRRWSTTTSAAFSELLSERYSTTMGKSKITTLLLLAAVIQLAGCQQPIFQNGAHPTVRYGYYRLHPHRFSCKDDPYSCKECPVGKPDRVIHLKHGNYRDVPVEVNLFFACDEINMLVPEHGPGVYSDEFVCQREPQDGFIEMGGHTYSCAQSPQPDKFSLGTLKPGETKTLTIPIEPPK